MLSSVKTGAGGRSGIVSGKARTGLARPGSGRQVPKKFWYFNGLQSAKDRMPGPVSGAADSLCEYAIDRITLDSNSYRA